MKIKYSIIPAILGLVLLNSCTEPLKTDYRGQSDNKLVVIGEMSCDTTAHTVILSRTVDYNADQQQMETGATVTISDGIDVFDLHETKPGIYQTDSNVFGQVDHEYLLSVTTSKGETAQARSTIKSVSKIDSVKVKFEYFSFFEEYYYKIYFYGQEPAGKGNYYLWNLYLNDSLYNDTLSKTEFESDDFVDGKYIKDFDLYWLEPKDVISDTTVFRLEMMSITEEYYQHLLDIMLETAWRGGPFDATPANVSTNIEGENATGFFATLNKQEFSVTHIKTEEEKQHSK